ncbi:unnamed protein product [Sphenostylis stenocarpa]|uniref:phosphopantothenoylcysteine decarboxylase n=1 Tax=Sphenostylis stenocarpa TaxID=92480 RepID=A0AA86V8Z8_9FABA|nr:unnamed protein product [Sphenostylis stenocarpa]
MIASFVQSEAVYAVRRKPRILLAACGCSDAAKFGLLCKYFSVWAKVGVVLTQSSLQFINAEPMAHLYVTCADSSIEYLEWADVMVIAPLSANTLAKIAKGLSDNLVTEIVRGWDYDKALYVAPSMDPIIWNDPLTAQQCNNIEKLGISIIIPPSPTGENEFCQMAEPSEISYTIYIGPSSYTRFHGL